MEFKDYLLTEGDIRQSIKQLISGGLGKADRLIKNAKKQFVNMVKKSGKEKEVIDIINNSLGTKFRTLQDLQKKKIQENEEYIAEDLKHFWNFITDQMWPSLSFYPILTVWLELDKLFNELDPNWKKVGTYIAVWLFLLSTKHIVQWKKWKKSNPEEFEKEGKPGAFSLQRR